MFSIYHPRLAATANHANFHKQSRKTSIHSIINIYVNLSTISPQPWHNQNKCQDLPSAIYAQTLWTRNPGRLERRYLEHGNVSHRILFEVYSLSIWGHIMRTCAQTPADKLRISVKCNACRVPEHGGLTSDLINKSMERAFQMKERGELASSSYFLGVRDPRFNRDVRLSWMISFLHRDQENRI